MNYIQGRILLLVVTLSLAACNQSELGDDTVAQAPLSATPISASTDTGQCHEGYQRG